MNASRTLKPSIAAAAISLLLGSAGCLASDAVAESFTRMFAHQPVQGAPVNVSQSEVDPLVAALVVPLREGVLRPAAGAGPLAADDPVVASFDRMFNHEAFAGPRPVPAGFDADPLLAALVEPLRRMPVQSVAATNHDSARTSRKQN